MLRTARLLSVAMLVSLAARRSMPRTSSSRRSPRPRRPGLHRSGRGRPGFRRAGRIHRQRAERRRREDRRAGRGPGRRQVPRVAFAGGLPGDGWDGKTRVEGDGQTKDGVTVFTVKEGTTGTIQDGVLTIKDGDGKVVGTLKKVLPQSPTLGRQAAGRRDRALRRHLGRPLRRTAAMKDGLLMEGATSKQKFQSYSIHLEFMHPLHADRAGPGPRQQRLLLAGPLRDADPRFLRAGAEEQRVRRHLRHRRAEDQHVVSAAVVADVRRRLHGRRVPGRQEGEERPADGAPQRRRGADRNRGHARHDRRARSRKVPSRGRSTCRTTATRSDSAIFGWWRRSNESRVGRARSEPHQ